MTSAALIDTATVELVVFNLKPGVAEASFLRAAEVLMTRPAVQAMLAFVDPASVTLLHAHLARRYRE
jgi:hypothetical protein